MRLTLASEIQDGDWIESHGTVAGVAHSGTMVALTFDDGTVVNYGANDEVYYE